MKSVNELIIKEKEYRVRKKMTEKVYHTLKYICKRKKEDINKRNTIKEHENSTVIDYDECTSILNKERLTPDMLLSFIYFQQINKCIYNYLKNRLLLTLTTKIIISAINHQHILLCNIIYK